jgi:hypothetical protein
MANCYHARIGTAGRTRSVRWHASKTFLRSSTVCIPRPMHWRRPRALLLLLFLASILIPSAADAQVDVLTHRYDRERSGANIAESTLNTHNVNAAQFGKLYSYPVGGSVYAQPLYVRGVTVNGQRRNVLYVATMNDKVYAFNADSSSSTPLWMRDFTSAPSVTAIPITDIVGRNDLNIVGNVGIQGTPVIDDARTTMFFVARTKENGAYVQRLHALDISTGLERSGSPVTIAGSVAGNGVDSTLGTTGKIVTFNPRMQSQRAALAMTKGVVLVAWAAHEDLMPYHGWVMAFDQTTLARVGIFCVSPDASGGGIWQGGRAPAIDTAGNAYFATGNGRWDGIRNFGDSLLKLAASRSGLSGFNFFTPANQGSLDINDDDLSGSGFTVLHGTNNRTLLLGGGKEGVLYLLDAANLGHLQARDAQVVQKLPVSGGHVMGGPALWNSETAGSLVYNWSEDDVLKAYQFTGEKLGEIPYAQGTVLSPGHPGGSLTISGAAGVTGTAIVWASMPTSQDGIHGKVAGMLRAFDAETLREIWTSERNATRDRVGTLMKFVPPVVVGGKVFIPNHDGAVDVYGLLPVVKPDFRVVATPSSPVVAPGATATIAVSVLAQGGFSGAVTLSATGQPAGAGVSFSPATVTPSQASKMLITLPASVPPGRFSVAIRGTSGALVALAAVVVTAADSAAIGINFVGTSPMKMASGESAGIVVQANWNNAIGGSATAPKALVDAVGRTTRATIAWSAYRGWATPISDAPGDHRLMKGYLDSTSTSTTTVVVAGLAQRTYDVYVYVDGDNRTYDRTAVYAIAPTGMRAQRTAVTDQANVDFGRTFSRASDSAGNYVKFTITASGFTVTAAPTLPASGTRRAPVNGIQVVPAGAAAPRRGAIGMKFNGSNTVPMAATESAGVLPMINWNNAAGATRSTPLRLVDDAGVLTNASATWTANAVWMTPIADRAGNARLMKGYLDTSSTGVTTVTVSGLPSGAYDVYVYVDGDNHEFTRTAAYSLGAPGVAPATVNATDRASVNFSGSFTRATNSSGNYVMFSIAATGFTLTARPVAGTTATRRAPVNAIQIVPK